MCVASQLATTTSISSPTLTTSLGCSIGLKREVGGVAKAIDARLELDEGAKGLEPRDLALVARADGVLLLHGVPGVGRWRPCG